MSESLGWDMEIRGQRVGYHLFCRFRLIYSPEGVCQNPYRPAQLLGLADHQPSVDRTAKDKETRQLTRKQFDPSEL